MNFRFVPQELEIFPSGTVLTFDSRHWLVADPHRGRSIVAVVSELLTRRFPSICKRRFVAMSHMVICVLDNPSWCEDVVCSCIKVAATRWVSCHCQHETRKPSQLGPWVSSCLCPGPQYRSSRTSVQQCQCEYSFAAASHSAVLISSTIQIPGDLRINFKPTFLLEVILPQMSALPIFVHTGIQLPREGKPSTLWQQGSWAYTPDTRNCGPSHIQPCWPKGPAWQCWQGSFCRCSCWPWRSHTHGHQSCTSSTLLRRRLLRAKLANPWLRHQPFTEQHECGDFWLEAANTYWG